MAKTVTDSRQVVIREFLQQLANRNDYDSSADAKPISTTELDNLLKSIDFETTPPLRLDASSPNDLTVSVGPSVVENTINGRKKTVSHAGSVLPSLSSGTIVFPSISGNTITVTPGNNNTLAVNNNEYVKVLIYLDKDSNLNVVLGNSDAVETNALVPKPPTNTIPIGYVTLFNNAGTIENINQSNIYQFGAGAGGGSGSGLFKVRLRDNENTVLPTGISATIDGVNIADEDLVLFTNLSSGNNQVYQVSGVGTSIVWDPVDAFNGELIPVDGDKVVIQEGVAFADQTATFDGTNFEINKIVRRFKESDWIEEEYIGEIQLNANETDTPIAELTVDSNEYDALSMEIKVKEIAQQGEYAAIESFSQNLNPINFLDDNVNTISEDSNEDLYIGGSFTQLNSEVKQHLIKVDKNGNEDTDFYTNLTLNLIGGVDGGILASATLPDGSVVIGGTFLSLNGNTNTRLAKLNADGTEDTTFSANIGSGFNNVVFAIDVAPDGKILVGGNFTSFNGNTRNRMVRLNPDGTEDTAFYTNLGTGFNSDVYAIKSCGISAIYMIWVGGAFTAVDGVTAGYVVKLDDSGTNTNDLNNFNDSVRAIDFEDSTSISSPAFIGGDFTQYDGQTASRMAILASNGIFSVVASPNLAKFDGPVRAIKRVTPSLLLVGGSFANWNGQPRNGFLAYDVFNQMEDSVFQSEFTNFGDGSGFGIGTTIYAITFKFISPTQPSENFAYIGGNFTSLNGFTSWERILRVDTTGNFRGNPTTNLGTGPNNNVRSLSIQPTTGNLIVAGEFLTIHGEIRNYLTSYEDFVANTEDISFITNYLGIPSGAFNNDVLATAVQPDGKILVGGIFSFLHGNARNRLVRLNPDGTEDTAFYSNLSNMSSTAFNGAVQSISVRDDDGSFGNETSIYVSGTMNQLNGTPIKNLIKLNSDGFDSYFSFNNNIKSFDLSTTQRKHILLSDNSIIVYGNFITYDAQPRNCIIKLNPDGTEDATFYANLTSTGDNTGFNTASELHVVYEQPDGKLLVGGNFTTLNGQPRGALVRLNSDGTEDATFYANLTSFGDGSGFNSRVLSIAINSIGEIIVGGNFTQLNNEPGYRSVHLTEDGFFIQQTTGNLGSFNNDVRVLHKSLTNDDIFAGGQFTSIYGNNVYQRLAKLEGTINSQTASAIKTIKTVVDDLGNVGFTEYGADTGVATTFNADLDGSDLRIKYTSGIAAPLIKAFIKKFRV